MSIVEMRKLVKQLFRKKGTNGNKASNMTEYQILAVYKKYLDEINIMREDIINMELFSSHMQDEFSSSKLHAPMWSDREVNDYAFEE